MKEIKIGDRVGIRGATQSYILVDPDKVYRGEVIGKESGQLLVKLDQPVMRGTVEFREVNVPETDVSLSKE
jgi:hypothetical protein